MADVTPGPVDAPRVDDDEQVETEKNPMKPTTPDPLKEKKVGEDVDPAGKNSR